MPNLKAGIFFFISQYRKKLKMKYRIIVSVTVIETPSQSEKGIALIRRTA
jgi:hypothetical protein